MQLIKWSLLFAALNAVAPATAPLRVLRVHPAEEAEPLTEIAVTFDRPVAGLDVDIPPERIFRIEPAVAGRLEWRDPVTLRLVPAAPLTPGATYTITISRDFAALDGSALEQPYRHTFRVKPTEVLFAEPIGPDGNANYITPKPTLSLLLSGPADTREFANRSFIQMSRTCGPARVELDVVRTRRLGEDDSWRMRYMGIRGNPTDTARDLRRVVELTPRTPLPLDCTGVLVVPANLDRGAGELRWAFSTYSPLAVNAVTCALDKVCPTGPIRVMFSTPVSGAQVQRHVRIAPNIPFTVRDTLAESAQWILQATLKPRQYYSVVVAPELTDVFGQKLGAQAVKPFTTTGYAPSVTYEFGKLLIERNGFRTLAVQGVNIDTLLVTSIAVPDTAEAEFLATDWNWAELFKAYQSHITTRKLPITGSADTPFLAGVPFPAVDARTRRNGTLVAVHISRTGETKQSELRGVALIQVTDLAIHGRIGQDEGMVWVTGVHDGRPRANVNVTLFDAAGKPRANGRTDAQGLVRLANFRPATERQCRFGWCGNFQGYISATLNDDRAVVGLNLYDPDLAPWRFGISGAWSEEQRTPAAAAVFTERGIYRPGEKLYAKAIVRRGPLGALTIPARNDSIRWTFQDREGTGMLHQVVAPVSAFGTADQSFELPGTVPLGTYTLLLDTKRDGNWETLARTSYEVAEYRPPEFLVDVLADDAPRFVGDSIRAAVSARYLFGAPMARADVRWIVQQRPLNGWELNIPNTEGYTIGDYASLDYDAAYDQPGTQVVAQGVDTLDARGQLDLSVPAPASANGRGARVGVLAVVTDANRQAVTAGTSVLVHPASFYIGVKKSGSEYFWRAGRPVTLDVIAVRPTGERVENVSVNGVIMRREWHRVRRERNGVVREVGSWVTDTVATCRVLTQRDPAQCHFTPQQGGSYIVAFTAKDDAGREARTGMWQWAAGAGWVPWRDDTQLKIDVIADRQRYSVGDTATVMIASPFTDVEAWVTIERERVLESRRIRITDGATTIKVPITEALAPNAFVSVLMVRGRSAEPGPIDDPGRPALRVGYTELRVLPEVKRLKVDVATLAPEYRPGDSAKVRINVRDQAGVGQRAEVTLWAVDEGVLALTGYQTPDPIDLLYQEKPLGVRLASNLASVAAQIPPGQKGRREAGGGGGGDIAGILRSRFQTTAFFLGSVVTDASGEAVASAKLPDNLTTFRVMAVAVTAGDRYGSGQTSMLVSRPLVARPALPRFVREGDRFAAGVVVNQRMGGTNRVDVEAKATGINISGSKKKSQTLSGAAPGDVRFDFRATAGDSARFQFVARSGREADAVAISIPVRPNYHPLAHTIAGVVHDTSSAMFTLGDDVDPKRSTLEISFGSSALAVIRGAHRSLRVYPYFCTEQIVSSALPLIALYRAQKELNTTIGLPDDALENIQAAVRTIVRRQRADGGIGYWSVADWSSPWLTAYAGRVLVEARDAGVPVEQAVLDRMAAYLVRSLTQSEQPRFALAHWYENNLAVQLSERVAAIDLLSRLGQPQIAIENTLIAQAGQLHWEDRVRLAEVLARRNAMAPARTLLESAWQNVRVEGRRITLPPTATSRWHYFRSEARPAARLLSATLAIEPNHPQLGALVETVVMHGRGASQRSYWNTQDFGQTVLALTAFEQRQRAQQQGTIRFRAGNRTVVSHDLRSPTREVTVSLDKLVKNGKLQLDITAQNTSAPVYYFATVREIPKKPPVRPVDNGIQVERWYESVDTRKPTMSVKEGDLVRVRLRITIPAERQFVVLDDPLPAGLEAVDLSLRTVSPFGAWDSFQVNNERDAQEPNDNEGWWYGSWDAGVWSPFDHKELRDDRVVYSAAVLWKGTYSATYLARATTAGTFTAPPAHAEEMYNPAVNGRTGGGTFTVQR